MELVAMAMMLGIGFTIAGFVVARIFIELRPLARLGRAWRRWKRRNSLMFYEAKPVAVAFSQSQSKKRFALGKALHGCYQRRASLPGNAAKRFTIYF